MKALTSVCHQAFLSTSACHLAVLVNRALPTQPSFTVGAFICFRTWSKRNFIPLTIKNFLGFRLQLLSLGHPTIKPFCRTLFQHSFARLLLAERIARSPVHSPLVPRFHFKTLLPRIMQPTVRSTQARSPFLDMLLGLPRTISSPNKLQLTLRIHLQGMYFMR